MSEATLDEICVVACAEAWRGDGAILASPIGIVPMIAARLARETFSPDLLITDGEALLISNPLPVGEGDGDKIVEAPRGAHFTSCVPDYERDEPFQREYASAASDDDSGEAFRDRFLAGTEDDYRAAVGAFHE